MNNTIKDLFSHEISDLYSAEVQILQALEKALDKVSDDKLKNILAHHLKETEVHKERLKQLSAECQLELDTSHVCEGMKGILAEGESVFTEFDEPAIDVAFSLASRRVEHYEMAGYMAAKQIASVLGESSAVQLLDQTLGEEEEADNKLVIILDENLLKKLESAAE